MVGQPGGVPQVGVGESESVAANSTRALSELLITVKEMKRKIDEGPRDEQDFMDMYESDKLPPEAKAEIGNISDDERKALDEEGVYPDRIAAIFQRYAEASRFEVKMAVKLLKDVENIHDAALDKVIKEIQRQPNSRRQLAALALHLAVDYGAVGEERAADPIQVLADALSREITDASSLARDDPEYMKKLEALEEQIRQELPPELNGFVAAWEEIDEIISTTRVD